MQTTLWVIFQHFSSVFINIFMYYNKNITAKCVIFYYSCRLLNGCAKLLKPFVKHTEHSENQQMRWNIYKRNMKASKYVIAILFTSIPSLFEDSLFFKLWAE